MVLSEERRQAKLRALAESEVCTGQSVQSALVLARLI